MTEIVGVNVAESTPDYLTNSDLFSNHYLTDHLPDTEVWESVDEEELERVYREIADLYDRRKDSVERYNESMLEQRFIRPVFDILGIDYGVEEEVQNTRRRPDYGFFKSDEAVDRAFERTQEGGDFYEDAIAVADAKYWGRALDSQGDDRHTIENPSFQISVYLDETPAEWAVLTNGKHWRIYYARTSKRLDSYYEINLPALLDICEPEVDGGLEPFKHFYLFFRQAAFTDDGRGHFIDRVREESNIFAQELGEDLKDNIYDAIGVLAEGFLTNDENDLTESDLQEIHDASLIYLYRLIFVLYAESEGRDLLDTNNEYYRERYSLNTLKQEVSEKRDDPTYEYPTWEDDLWERLDDLFELIDQGSEAKGIPEDELYIPAYNGGLFRTDPGEEDPREAHFLQENSVDDRHLAKVIDLLARSKTGNGDGKTFVDYSSLNIRHLGGIYEGLLEYQINVAEESLTVEDGQYVPTNDEDAVVEVGEVYLTTDSGERKATGSYYTPQEVVEYIVEDTLDPLLTEIRDDLLGEHDQFAEEFADQVFELNVLDPAMGSAHFLTEVVDHLAREIIDAQQRQAEQQEDPSIDESRDINWARRQVAQKCVYGVDVNPLAVELAKVSLWLRTLAAEQPLAFLDHHLRTGNSLVGSDIEEIVEENGDGTSDSEGGEPRQVTLGYDFEQTKQDALEHLMDVYQGFITIENRDRADVKEMEEKYRDIEKDELRNQLVAMANVHTAERYGVDVPPDAYERLASGLEDQAVWDRATETEWFERAQRLADRKGFFHWKLEFPEVFYNESGDEIDQPGFDVVIGNPPYVFIDSIPEDDRDYYRETSSTWDYRYDLYGLFTEQGFDLLREGGHFGYIIPHNLLNNDSFEDLREHALEVATDIKIIDFTDAVFDDASNEPMILTSKVQSEESASDPVLHSALISFDKLESADDYLIEYSASMVGELPSSPFLVRGGDWIEELLRNDDTSPLGDYVHAVQGLRTGDNTERLTEEPTEPEHRPAIPGDDIHRYGYDWSGTYVLYDRELLSNDTAARPREEMYWEADEKILVQEIRNVHLPRRIVACLDTEKHIGLNTTNAIITRDETEVSLYYVMAILSSTLVNEFFRCCFVDNHIATQYLQAVPLYDIQFTTPEADREEIVDDLMEQYDRAVDTTNPEIFLEPALGYVEGDEFGNDVAHDILSELSKRMISMTETRTNLNLNLLDYLGGYEEGKELAELSEYQPADSVHETLLSETTENYDGLRIGSLSVDDRGSGLTISATVRYKPDDDEEYDPDLWSEPDQWGYIERQEMIPVVELHSLDERTRAVVSGLVKDLNEHDDGFANFYEQATQTKSLIDRIKAITLPALDGAGGDIDRYVSKREQAQELESKIDITDEMIDTIVYRLYGLSESDISEIQSAI